MPIIGMTDRGASLPRLGILRKGGPKTDLKRPGPDLKDHFKFDTDDAKVAETFAALYGPKPNDIRVMLMEATTAGNLETWKEHWSAGALKHRCDGQTCVLSLQTDGTYSHEPVPCPSIAMLAKNPNTDKMHLCKASGRLKVIVPELGRMAHVLVTTTSIHDIMELQQNLEAIEALRGDLRGIPLVLSRKPRKVSTPNPDGTRRRMEKWLLSLEPDAEWVQLQMNAMRRAALPNTPLALPAPAAEIEPMDDPGADDGLFDVEDSEPQDASYTPPAQEVPQPAEMTAEEAARRFYARYGEIIGGTTWKHAQTYLGVNLLAPRTAGEWVLRAEMVRDEAKHRKAQQEQAAQDAAQRPARDADDEELFNEIEQTERERQAVAA